MNLPLASPLCIGFVGVGKMGLPMSRHIAALGHDVIAVEPLSARRELAVGSGLGAVASVGELPPRTQLVFSSLPDDRALLSVVDDVARAGRPGWCFLDASTVSLAASQCATGALDAAGVAHLRVPVSGNAAMAEAAQLTTLASGPRALFERVQPLLAAWGPTQFYLGPGDEARLMKLVLNLMIAHTSAMLAEALTLGQKGGLQWPDLWQVLTQSAVASPIVRAKSVPLRERDFTPTFTVKQMCKDLGLILDAGRTLGVALPLTRLVDEGQYSALAAGLGAQDYAAVIKVAEWAAGIKA